MSQGPYPGMDPYLELHWGDVHQRLITYICGQLQLGLPKDLRAVADPVPDGFSNPSWRPKMSGPFPGMDPYLERFWGDVHQAFITYSRDQLQLALPSDLRARMQERVFVELPEERHEYYPDVRVVERPRGGNGASTRAAVAERRGPAEPLVVQLVVEPTTEGYIEIIDVKSGRRVITTIEVLSPANKRPGEGRRLYLGKRDDMKRGGANIVEIDLLRGGGRTLMVGPERIAPARRATYYTCVWRATREDVVELYPMPLREPLPVVRVPLRPSDADALLDLQAVLDQCYRNGGYDDIDYAGPLDPPLSSDDAAWARGLWNDWKSR